MRTRRVLMPGLWVIVTLLAACTSRPPLPRHPSMAADEALQLIAERLESVRTISATCDMVMTDAAGQTVRLDGAIAAEAPSRVRLRAWKLGRVVFDVTMLDGRVWLMLPEGHEGNVQTKDFLEVAELMGAAFFRAAVVVPAELTAQRLVVSGWGLGESAILCEIDRPTLTPRIYTVLGRPREEASVILDRYAVMGGVPWPMRIQVNRSSGEVVVIFRDVEINSSLPEGALAPPRRAVLRP
jgi:hypothetical protein